VKTTKQSSKKRPASRRAPKAAARTRPLHKRVLLHPFTVMVLLCAGVIIAGSTIQGWASSYSVTAHLDAPLPSGPAVITAPGDQLHTTASEADVDGTCPPASYVVLFRGSNTAGTAPCIGNAFQMRISLIYGANQLQAKVFNVTNQEGPASAAITIYRDPVPDAPAVPTAPQEIPLTLNVASIDRTNVTPASTPKTSTSPTVSGFAPPFSDVVVTFHSEVQTCKTKADSNGWWSCTLANALPNGTHHVDVEAWTPEGVKLTYPTFRIVVLGELPSLIPQRITAPAINVDYQYQTHLVGKPFAWDLTLNGGKAPYKVTVNWGDGSESTLTRADGSLFTIKHAFPEKQTYTVFVSAVDANGTQTILQLFAIVKGQDGTAAVTNRPGPIISLLAMVQRYLWVVWPAYIAVVLMAFSYWLGEKEMYLRFSGRQLAHHGPRGSTKRRRV